MKTDETEDQLVLIHNNPDNHDYEKNWRQHVNSSQNIEIFILNGI